jgi:FMN phosphatase YigB (HAD superfamily)
MPGATALLRDLARDRTIAILSNWPLAITVDRYADAHGWSPFLDAIVVSQRVGTIKPHRAIFAAARSALGDPEPERILHVGDDWAADVVGALDAGWRAAWIRSRPEDSPLPSSEPDDGHTPDLQVDDLAGIGSALDRSTGRSPAARARGAIAR